MQAQKWERDGDSKERKKERERENNWKHAPFKRSLEKSSLIKFQWVLCRCRDVDGITDETKHQFKTKMIQKKCDNVWKNKSENWKLFFYSSARFTIQCNGSYEGIATCIIEWNRMAWMIVIRKHLSNLIAVSFVIPSRRK